MQRFVVRLLSEVWGVICVVGVIATVPFKSKLRTGITERLGGGGWKNISLDKSYLWIHAASVGEVTGIESLLKQIKSQYKILITTTSLTGRAKAKELGVAEYVCLSPLDNRWCLKRALEKINLESLIIVETELWPNLIFYAKRRGVDVSLINARISDYSFPRYKRFSWLLRPILLEIKTILTQTKTDYDRFIALRGLKKGIEVAGSTKYDRNIITPSEEDRKKLAESFGLSLTSPCLVAGSVREGEDEQIINAYKQLREQFTTLQLIIAPRHPERFATVKDLLKRQDVEFCSFSDKEKAASVIVLDTIGDLANAYALATVAFIGGTLVDIGGHNPLEPAAFGVPIVVGPYTSNVRDIVSSLKEHEGIVQVANAEEIVPALSYLFSSRLRLAEVGAGAKAAWQANLGATKKVVANAW